MEKITIPCAHCGKPIQSRAKYPDGIAQVCADCFKADMEKQLPGKDSIEFHKTFTENPENMNVTLDVDLRALDEAPVNYTGSAIICAIANANVGGDKNATVGFLAGKINAPEAAKMMSAIGSALSRTFDRADLMLIHMMFDMEMRKAIASKPEMNTHADILRLMMEFMGGQR